MAVKFQISASGPAAGLFRAGRPIYVKVHASVRSQLKEKVMYDFDVQKFNIKKRMILGFSCIMPVAMLLITLEIRKHISPFIFVYLQFEDKFSDKFCVMHTYMSSVFGKEFTKFQNIAKDMTIEPGIAISKLTVLFVADILKSRLRKKYGSVYGSACCCKNVRSHTL